jgi:parvulin-like peptidyl-prolyl isomerase
MNSEAPTGIVYRIIREPLTHFLLLGAVLFILYASVNDDRVDQVDRIVVDATQIKVLADQFQRTWMRPPTRQELAGLAEDFVKEEILYREAVALGLDQNDLIIRRRMRQKMEFLNSDLVEEQAADDATLQAYLDDNAAHFAEPERTSFEQIYFKTDEDEATARTRATATLAQLASAPATDISTLGDATLLPPSQRLASSQDIGRVFGESFAAHVRTAPAGQWSGPYPSAYGLHLLRVTQRTAARQPALDEIRHDVEREWYAQRRVEANEAFYQALRQRYSVDIELPGGYEDTVSLQTP